MHPKQRNPRERTRQVTALLSRFTYQSRQLTQITRQFMKEGRPRSLALRQFKEITRHHTGTSRQRTGTLRHLPGTLRQCPGTSLHHPGMVGRCTGASRRFPGTSRQSTRQSSVRRLDCDTFRFWRQPTPSRCRPGLRSRKLRPASWVVAATRAAPLLELLRRMKRPGS